MAELAGGFLMLSYSGWPVADRVCGRDQASRSGQELSGLRRGFLKIKAMSSSGDLPLINALQIIAPVTKPILNRISSGDGLFVARQCYRWLDCRKYWLAKRTRSCEVNSADSIRLWK